MNSSRNSSALPNCGAALGKSSPPAPGTDLPLGAGLPTPPKRPTEGLPESSRAALGKSSPPGPEDARFLHALEEYASLCRGGGKPNRAEFLTRYADLTSSLEDCLDGIEFVEQVAPQLRDASATPSHSALRIPHSELDSLGDFRLLREVGRGGMGVVYEAQQLSLRRRVAVKVLPLAGVLDKRALARFQNEATAAATLFHPHIVPVFYVGAERGVHFYAMQLIEGQSLAEVIHGLRSEEEVRSADRGMRSEEGGASNYSKLRTPNSALDTAAIAAFTTEHSTNPKRYFRRVAEIGIQIAEALHHAHEHGILHRDVKPANILLDSDGKAWITDFGLARLESDASMTMTGDLVGTLRYMSPEQVNGERAAVDHRTDVYSLGATLYEAITLRHVFSDSDRPGLLRRIAEEDPTPPRRIRPEIPPDLETIVQKTLAKDPHDRYASTAELSADLRRFLDNQVILARRPSLAARNMKWARRHPAFLVSAVCVLAAALAASLFAYGISSREQRKTASALNEKKAALAEMQTQRDRANEQFRRAEDERQRAIDHLKLARKIVDNLYTIVGTQWIADETAPTGFQQSVLTAAVDFYQNLAATPITRPNDLSELSLVASGYGRIGIIQHYLQNYEEAVEARRKCADVVGRAIAVDPRNPAIRSGIAEVNFELGQSLVELARFDDALAAFEESSTVAQQLVEEEFEPTRHRYWLARTELARAGVLARTGAPADAARVARAAKDNLTTVDREADKQQTWGGDMGIDGRRGLLAGQVVGLLGRPCGGGQDLRRGARKLPSATEHPARRCPPPHAGDGTSRALRRDRGPAG